MNFLRYILSRTGRARRLLFASIAVGMTAGAASVGLLILVNTSLRRVEGGGGMRSLAIAFVTLIVLVTGARVLSVTFLSRLGQGMVRDLRLEISRQILASPLLRLEELGRHRLLASLTDDINALTQALISVPALFINGTIVVGCLAYLAVLDRTLFLMLLGAVVAGVVSYRLPASLGFRRFQEARQRQDELFDHFRSLTEGIKELKLHRRRREAFLRLLEITTEQVRKLRVAAAMIFGGASAWGHLLFFVVIGVLLFARPAGIEATYETLVGYTLVLLYMMTPLQMLLDNVPALSQAEVAVGKVRELGFRLAAAPEMDVVGNPAGASSPPPAPSPAAWRSLELAGVTHTYRREGQDRDFQLGPIDLTLAPGELVFLVGGNGSGKTTLAKILVGLYRPEAGAVVLDGHPVGDREQDDYRQHFSTVFSDFFLFERLLGLEASGLDDRARRYLEDLQIAHKVEVRDGELSTTDLSQGQRKRLALLTAYLEDRPIYVFDEWAADQDPVFKEIFYREILRDLQRRGKAILVISHDDRYFHLADRVIKLENGQTEGFVPARQEEAVTS